MGPVPPSPRHVVARRIPYTSIELFAHQSDDAIVVAGVRSKFPSGRGSASLRLRSRGAVVMLTHLGKVPATKPVREWLASRPGWVQIYATSAAGGYADVAVALGPSTGRP